jgi:hypothetical protein
MDRIARLLLVPALVTLAACSGSSSDDKPVQTVTTFTRSASAAVGYTNFYPFHAGDDWRIQGLYLATEVRGAGAITAIRFVRALDNAVAATCPSVTVRMGHTTLAALTTDFSANVDASALTTVATSAPVSIPVGTAGTWFEVPLATPYEYDGVENLVVDLETPASCSGTTTIGTLNAAGRRVLAVGTDTDPATPQHGTTGGVDNAPPALQFVFTGGGENRILAGNGPGNYYPLANGIVRIQSLQLASDIASSAGEITGVAFEPQGTFTSAYTITMRLGHTTDPVLATTLDANATDWVEVAHSVTIQMGAGGVNGNWLWFPMTRSFQYDGVRNLVIDIKGQGTASSYGFSTSTRTGARAFNTNQAATGNVDGTLYHAALRFKGAPIFYTRYPASTAAGTWLTIGHLTGQVQQVIPSHRVGSTGTVNRVGVRLGAAGSVAANDPVKIYVGQTTRRSLVDTDTYASNMDQYVLAYDGTLAIPGGIQAGEWFNVNLQTPFQYDGSKNLVLLFMHTRSVAAGGGNDVAYTSGADWPGSVYSGGNTSTVDQAPGNSWVGSVHFRIGMQ